MCVTGSKNFLKFSKINKPSSKFSKDMMLAIFYIFNNLKRENCIRKIMFLNKAHIRKNNRMERHKNLPLLGRNYDIVMNLEDLMVYIGKYPPPGDIS
jgi:hypothetical protein